jgi:vitamin B12 transporter
MRLSSKLLFAVSLGFGTLALPHVGSAQIQLEGIYVQGATLEGKSEATGTLTDTVGGIPLDKTGSAVSVVTGEQLRAQQVRTAIDALRSLPGVSVSQAGGPGGSPQQVRIRGAEGNHTLILIDGIDAGDTNLNEFDFANLLAEDIERIEVLRGPQSGLYGSKAIGGVINIVTRRGSGPLTATLRAEGGTYGTGDIAARISGGSDKAWFSLSAQQRGQQFFNPAPIGAEDDPWRLSNIMLKAGFTAVPGVAVDFLLRKTRRVSHYDDFFNPGGEPMARAVDADNRNETDSFLGGVNLRWSMLGGALTHVFSANRNTIDAHDQTPGGNSDTYNSRDKISYLGTYRFGALGAKHSVSGLVENEWEVFRPNFFFTDNVDRERNRKAYAFEYRGEFFDRLVLTGAARHDDNDTFADFTTWRLTASLGLPEYGIRPHASYGTAVALPGMFEQFGSVKNVFVGNPNLKPEESRGWDAGIEFTLIKNKALLDVTYFNADLTNEITGFGNSLTNLVGVSERSGVEVALRTQLLQSLYFGASYTFLDATEPNGNPEVRRPKNSARLDATYLFAGTKGTFNVAAVYNGSMHDNNFGAPGGRVLLDDYWLVSSAISYRLRPGVELFGRVENLFNQEYQEVSGYAAPGAAAFAGFKLTFGGIDGIGGAGTK